MTGGCSLPSYSASSSLRRSRHVYILLPPSITSCAIINMLEKFLIAGANTVLFVL